MVKLLVSLTCVVFLWNATSRSVWGYKLLYNVWFWGDTVTKTDERVSLLFVSVDSWGWGCGAEKGEGLTDPLNNEEKREYAKQKSMSDIIKYHATLASLFWNWIYLTSTTIPLPCHAQDKKTKNTHVMYNNTIFHFKNFHSGDYAWKNT